MKSELSKEQCEGEFENQSIWKFGNMRNGKGNIIVRKTFDFALEIIDYSEKLRDLKKFGMNSQLFRSGTSIGANSREAQNAESSADFIHKLKIAAKEADETNYWIKLCKASKHCPNPPEALFSEMRSIYFDYIKDYRCQ